jgi:hypothetical protein
MYFCISKVVAYCYIYLFLVVTKWPKVVNGLSGVYGKIHITHEVLPK